jgi:hypothetical protein
MAIQSQINYNTPVNTRGGAGGYGFVNGLPILSASGVNNYLEQLSGGSGKVQGVAHTDLDDSIGWDLSSASGFVVNGAAIAGLGKSVTQNEDGSTTITYQGDFDKAAQQVGINPASYPSQESLYEAINNQLKDTYIVGGAKRDGIIAEGTGNNVRAVYRREGDALVPVSQATAYEGVINPPSSSGFKKFVSDIAPIASIALIATGAGAALGGALLGAGASTAAAGALGGAIIGGTSSALTGDNVLQGAALGGAGGYIQGGGLSGIGDATKAAFADITGIPVVDLNATFAAQDAFTMAQNGLSNSAIQQNLIASGMDSLTAASLADAAILPGATAASLASTIASAPTYTNVAGMLSGGDAFATTQSMFDSMVAQGMSPADAAQAINTTGGGLGLPTVAVNAAGQLQQGASTTSTPPSGNNPLTNTAIRSGIGSLLSDSVGALPGAVAGMYGANQYANTLADYATALNQAARGYGTDLTTAASGIGRTLTESAAQTGGMITSGAATAGGLITGGAGSAGSLLSNTAARLGAGITSAANTQAGKTTALAGQLAPTVQFTPVGMTTRFGSTTQPRYDSNGKLIGFGYNVASDIAAQRDRLLSLSSEALPTTTNVQQATEDYYNQLQALQNPAREQQLAGLRNQLQATGRGGLAFGATSGVDGNALAATNPELAAYYNALAQTQSQQALSAQDVAQQRLNQQLALSSGLFGQAQTLEGAGQQAMALGTNLGQLATTGATNAANIQLNAQQQAAAQVLSAQLQAAGMETNAANSAAQMQVQASIANAQMQNQATIANAQMQNQAAMNAANLQSDAQRQAALQNLLAGQTGAQLLSQGAQAQNAAIQAGLLRPAQAAGSVLAPLGQAAGQAVGNAVGGILGSAVSGIGGLFSSLL